MNNKELVEALFAPTVKIYDVTVGKILKPFNLKNIAEIDCFLMNLNSVLISCDEKLKNTTIVDLNKIAVIPLRIISELKLITNFDYQREVIRNFKPLTNRISEVLKTAAIQVFNESNFDYYGTSDSEMPKVFLDYFERSDHVNNPALTFWNAVSLSLFADYSLTEMLRLQTAVVLIEFEKEFRSLLEAQKTKFGYKTNIPFEGLLDLYNANQINFLNDEFYLLALSLAIRRPIYVYSHFNLYGTSVLAPTVPELYHAAQETYENSYKFGHYRFVGFEVDEDKEPICLYHTVGAGYLFVMAKYNDVPVKPWKPKTLFFDYLVPKVVESSKIETEISDAKDFEFEKESDTESIVVSKTDFELEECLGEAAKLQLV